MVLDETKQRCLNYAATVPEWTLTEQLKAVRALSACASKLTDIVQALTAGMIYDRYEHPYDREGDRPDYSRQLRDAGYFIGKSVYALEVLASENPFSYARDPSTSGTAWTRNHRQPLWHKRFRISASARKMPCMWATARWMCPRPATPVCR